MLFATINAVRELRITKEQPVVPLLAYWLPTTENIVVQAPFASERKFIALLTPVKRLLLIITSSNSPVAPALWNKIASLVIASKLQLLIVICPVLAPEFNKTYT